MGVADVQADADAIEVADAKYLEEIVRGGDLVLEIFEQDAYAEWMSECFEMLDCGERVFEGARVPGIVFVAEVEHTGVDGNLLCGLEGALDLIHRADAMGFFDVDEIDIRSHVARPLSASSIAKEDGLMQRRGYAGVAKPDGNVADSGAIGVVEVMTRGEELDSFGTAFMEGIKQARVQALLKEDVCGYRRLHQILRYSSGTVFNAANGCRVCRRMVTNYGLESEPI
jgi:hypothetical protein